MDVGASVEVHKMSCGSSCCFENVEADVGSK